LEEPGTEGANSQSIRLENDAGEPLIELVIGDRKPARRRQMVSDIYVRTVGEKQTWTVEGSLPNIVDTVGWLADSLIELESRRVRQVQVRHADGGLTTVNHTPGVGQGYSLENVPEGREIDSGYVVQSVVTGIMKFPLDDVGAAEDLAAAKGEDLTITITAYDGLQVTMKGVLNDEDAVLAFSARYLADEAKHPAPKAEGQQKNTDIIKLTKDAVVAEVERLNRRWAPWTFTVGKWRLATALKKVDEFLKPEPDPAAADVTPTPTATAPIVGPTNVAKPNQ
jgi:hypothetical protein